MKLYDNVLDLIGKTPLMLLKNYMEKNKLEANLIGKVEFFNPAGSIKDRIAKQMIMDALAKNLIDSDTEIIEATSGNTGIALAMIGASLKLKVTIVMPETMSIERRKLISAYGAKIELTSGSLGMKGAIAYAATLKEKNKNSFIPSQFYNESNPLAHYLTTGKEIYDDLDGNVDILVAGVGTGGTISGIGKYLKEKNKNVKIVAVEPSSSPVLSKNIAGPHKIQGIGAGFVPNTLDTGIYDEIITISNEDAFSETKEIAKTDGLFVGISSGAAIKAASILASRPENKGKNIVVILPDTGTRYLSILD